MRYLIVIILTVTLCGFAAAETIKTSVNGMVCAFCATGIEKTFKAQQEVKKVDVDLEHKLVTIETREGQTLDDAKLKKLFGNSGYSVVGIARGEEMNLRVIFLDVATVLSSFSTLVCCALPALLVSIGAGAALAGLVSVVPQLVWISEHKIPVFALAGLMLVISGISTYRGRLAPCPTDPAQAQSCLRLRRLSAWILGFSAFLYATGFFFAFVMARIS